MLFVDLPVTGQTPCTAHASLKNIIRRVLRDASNMAILKEPQTETASAADTTQNRTYEDLLATAILNKVLYTIHQNIPMLFNSYAYLFLTANFLRIT